MFKRHGSANGVLVGLLCIVPVLLLGAIDFFGFYLPYQNNCGGLLKRAADANDIATAQQELNQAVTYLRQQKMTEGYTSIFYRTPDEDVGFWYRNLNTSLAQLNEAAQKRDLTLLEQSNTLMKLRETLTDNGRSGTTVTEPPGIHKFPHNKLWFFLYTIAILPATVGLITARSALD